MHGCDSYQAWQKSYYPGWHELFNGHKNDLVDLKNKDKIMRITPGVTQFVIGRDNVMNALTETATKSQAFNMITAVGALRVGLLLDVVELKLVDTAAAEDLKEQAIDAVTSQATGKWLTEANKDKYGELELSDGKRQRAGFIDANLKNASPGELWELLSLCSLDYEQVHALVGSRIDDLEERILEGKEYSARMFEVEVGRRRLGRYMLELFDQA